MKNSILSIIFLACIIFTGCKKNGVDASVNAMSAVAGSSAFSSTSVSAQLIPSVALPGKTQLTIGGYSGNKILIIVFPDYVASSVGTSYSVTSNTASGSYNDGTFEDVFINGTVTITSVSNEIISGTFDFYTRTSVHISGGSFTVKM